MSETFIPLSNALEEERCRAAVLQKLRAGEIAAYAAESYGADIAEWFVTDSAEALVQKVFGSNAERRVALRHLEQQCGPTRYLWAAVCGYLAVSDQSPEVVAYNGQGREKEGQCPVPKSIWRQAFIDERRSVVVYDNFEHIWRKEYMHVHIDDASFRRIRRDCTDVKASRAGRPSISRSDVVAYAEDLVSGSEIYTFKKFMDSLVAKFGYLGVENTVDTHYGDIWRSARERRKDEGQKTQKPKNTQ